MTAHEQCWLVILDNGEDRKVFQESRPILVCDTYEQAKHALNCYCLWLESWPEHSCVSHYVYDAVFADWMKENPPPFGPQTMLDWWFNTLTNVWIDKCDRA